ncbi:MFS transporter [Streptomyces sp. V1I6]|uniref:MFS transporter n=1 Tax=Streptomyces sp. V1I6 TaxID=3042273 RepID=UPI002789CC63|nr:MFS transporter [Streptomyces sp. V1I6]MDQ0846323.1 EmrB/QacA subfamily drug resistance transporter [Streptomyces sp. V1I6]
MSRIRILGIVAAVLLSSFLTALDNTAVNIALPQMGKELALGETEFKWVAAVYPLALASFLLLGGHLTDTRGRRWTLLTGLAAFTASSTCCALSATGTMLIFFRGMQGFGAALILPASLAILSHDLPPRARTASFGATMAVLASALALGPVISGFVTQYSGWQWLFLMNVPLGLASFTVGAVAVSRPAPDRTGSRTLAAVSLRLLASACVSCAAVVYCLIEGPAYGFTSPPLIVAGCIAVIGSTVTCCTAASHRTAALTLLFRQKPFTGGVITQLLWGLGVSGVYFYTSQFLQNGLRLSPTAAGLAFTPVAAVLLLTAPFVTPLARRWGDHRISAAGLALVASGLLLIAVGSPHGDLAHLLPGLSAVGAGSALALPLTTRALESSPNHLSGFAAGLFSATRELSGVFGIAFVGAVVTFVQHGSASAEASPAAAFLAGYQTGLCIAAVLVAAAAPVAVWALRTRPVDGGKGWRRPLQTPTDGRG